MKRDETLLMFCFAFKDASFALPTAFTASCHLLLLGSHKLFDVCATILKPSQAVGDEVAARAVGACDHHHTVVIGTCFHRV